MPNPPAIRLRDVSKVYRLHGSQSDQLIDVLGLQRFGFKTRTLAKEFEALSGISLDVPRGHRIGIVGRNGAGKTTLLKLVCGNFAPSKGEIEINGAVQALMNVGLGFHPEYTGRENAEASLQYNGLSRGEYQKAMDGIIEFCELGDFLDQPFKTYSMGMQARLMFAAATAIRPDILIVDEVLGAGDAYFVTKSKMRVESLINSGCTMLLVSHSMQQVLELCDRVIWLDQGKVRMDGEAFTVVKAYEEFIHAIKVEHFGGNVITHEESACSSIEKEAIEEAIGVSVFSTESSEEQLKDNHKRKIGFEGSRSFDFVAKGGVSRWVAMPGLEITGFTIAGRDGRTNELGVFEPTRFIFYVVPRVDGEIVCRYGIAIHSINGDCVCRTFSGIDRFVGRAKEPRMVELAFDKMRLGSGEYTIGISISAGDLPIEMIGRAANLDLLNRSFAFKVSLPSSISSYECAFYPPAQWSVAIEGDASMIDITG